MSDKRLTELGKAVSDAATRLVAADTEEEFEKLYGEYKRLEAEFMREWRERDEPE